MAYQQDHRRDPLSTGGTATSAGSSTMGSSAGSSTYGHADDIQNERDDTRSAAIERDIDRTRSRMDETVENLTQRLRPSSILGDLLDYFGSEEGTRTTRPEREKVKRVARRAGHGVWETVKSNPMPSALIAGWIAWMFLKGDDDEEEYRGPRSYRRMARRSAEPPMYGGSYVDARTGEPYDLERYGDEMRDVRGMGWEEHERRSEGPGVTDRLKSAASGAAEGVRSAAGWVAEKASDAASAVGSAASGAAHSVSDTASGATEGIRSGAGGAWEGTRQGAERAGEWSRHMASRSWRGARRGYGYSRDRFEHGMHEYPLGMALGALAAGLLAGMTMPRTRREDRMFGRYAHELKDRAGHVASEAWERGQSAAEGQGLDPRSLKEQARDFAGRVSTAASHVAQAAVESAKHVAGGVAEAAKAEARDLKREVKDQGLTPGSLKDSAKAVVQETARGAKDAAGRETDEAKRKHGWDNEGGSASGGAFTGGGISTMTSGTGTSSSTAGSTEWSANTGASRPPGLTDAEDDEDFGSGTSKL